MLADFFPHTPPNLNQLPRPLLSVRERKERIPIAGVGVEEHGTPQMRDPESGEEGVPAG